MHSVSSQELFCWVLWIIQSTQWFNQPWIILSTQTQAVCKSYFFLALIFWISINFWVQTVIIERGLHWCLTHCMFWIIQGMHSVSQEELFCFKWYQRTIPILSLWPRSFLTYASKCTLLFILHHTHHPPARRLQQRRFAPQKPLPLIPTACFGSFKACLGSNSDYYIECRCKYNSS